ncbi:fimbria/pilus periplasmic chaperone [uncultured Pantoea sp.]|uniref:fimbria/pilus periplasmic chaperone n=1 Tax=uncultured Pantoea sp. TaxID=218084 RepID=UPI0027D97168|nr:fimbria/pilus periplasmic chaperone [uncultured Pantoea sp.]
MYSRIVLYPSLFVIFILLMTFISDKVQASVTILGSRIIYPGNALSVDVQLKNNDNIPYVIQAWFDNGNMDSQPGDKSDVPFIITPPLFRIQPLTGQVLRIRFTPEASLPQDRETVYWFNSLQIPPANIQGESGRNSIVLMLRNRMKLFYRPTAIGQPGDIFSGIKITAKKEGIEINNTQPWFFSLTDVTLKTADKKIACDADMIAPFSKKIVRCKAATHALPANSVVSLSAMNDQGAKVSEDYPLAAR